MPQRLVVIGGGAAGMSAASAARRTDPELEVVVLEGGGYAAYGMCGIPYYLAAEVSGAEDLLAYPPDFFRRKRGIDLRLRTRALALDPHRRRVRYRDANGEHWLDYDRLVLATGSVPVMPKVPGLDPAAGGPGRDPVWEDERVVTVRSLDDAIELRHRIDMKRVRSALVVGAGYVGLEMADVLRARGVSVTLAEALPQVMVTLDEPIAALVEKELRRGGVDLRLGCPLQEVRRSPDGDQLTALVDGDPIAVDLLVLAVGVRPAAALAAEAGAKVGPAGALLVDQEMATSLPGVYAAGDCAAPYHLVLGRPAYVPLGPTGNKTGRVAGTVAAGGRARFRGVVGTAVVKVFELGVARTGLTLVQARAKYGDDAIATDAVGRSKAKYYPGAEPVTVRLVHRRSGRVLGAQMVSAGEVAKRIDVVATALHAGFGVQDLLGLDLSYAPPFAPVYEPVLLAAQAAVAAAGSGDTGVTAGGTADENTHGSGSEENR